MKIHKKNQLIWLIIITSILVLTLAIFLAYKIKQDEKKEYFVQLGRANALAQVIATSLDEQLNKNYHTLAQAILKNDLSKIENQIDGLLILKDNAITFPQNINEAFFNELSEQVSSSKIKAYKEIKDLIKSQQYQLAKEKLLEEEKDTTTKNNLLFLHLRSILLFKQDKTEHYRSLLAELLLNKKKDVASLPWIFWESVFIGYLEISPEFNDSFKQIFQEMIYLVQKHYLSNDFDYFWQKLTSFMNSHPTFVSSETHKLINLKANLIRITKNSIACRNLNLQKLPSLINNMDTYNFDLNDKPFVIQISINQEKRIFILLSWKRIKELLDLNLRQLQKDSLFQFYLTNKSSLKSNVSKVLSHYSDISLNLTSAENGLNKIKKRNQMLLIILFITVAFITTCLYFLYKIMLFQLTLAKMRTDFVTNVSHELRTPIAAIQLMSETLANQSIKEDKDLLEYYHLIHNDSKRLGSLINNVLDFSKLESGNKKYEFKDNSILESIENVKASYCLNSQANHPIINIDSNQDKIIFKYDSNSMEQIISNLIENSIKYARNNQRPEITLTINIKDNSVNIILQDNAKGIHPSDLPHVFDKFFRGGNLTTQNINGNGLGLSIVKQLVEVHHGSVKIESTINEGTKILLSFPKSQ
ncbi:MAG: hypothetical protein COA79_09885 [Planctomycetota bacterium]|nr:MAG: hypothetical protein COA79_09885 [Planctomycetota bacterium]